MGFLQFLLIPAIDLIIVRIFYIDSSPGWPGNDRHSTETFQNSTAAFTGLSNYKSVQAYYTLS